MYFRLMGKLSARRKAILDGGEKEQGFTLIELLVVVVIIGVLAAIAIPIYIGLQNGAKDSAAKSDLNSVKTAVVAYYAQNPSAPAAPALTAAVLGNFGFVASDGVTGLAYGTTGTPSATAFCIQATSAAGNTFSVTQSGGIATAACP
ncbi:type IV pilin protein [Rathayibacter soli]|uniref:type IV pilin protein n=1 Tax=Rathayibacter soli TaxID=3144168 RepID=UPI0027E50D3F|nr:prepilin-type N-terminal cleavage/methylation domain-containing protein [Glaciibacter superstes]